MSEEPRGDLVLPKPAWTPPVEEFGEEVVLSEITVGISDATSLSWSVKLPPVCRVLFRAEHFFFFCCWIFTAVYVLFRSPECNYYVWSWCQAVCWSTEQPHNVRRPLKAEYSLCLSADSEDLTSLSAICDPAAGFLLLVSHKNKTSEWISSRSDWLVMKLETFQTVLMIGPDTRGLTWSWNKLTSDPLKATV